MKKSNFISEVNGFSAFFCSLLTAGLFLDSTPRIMAELHFCCLFVSASLSETEESTKPESSCLVKKRLSVFKPQKVACWPLICDVCEGSQSICNVFELNWDKKIRAGVFAPRGTW